MLDEWSMSVILLPLLLEYSFSQWLLGTSPRHVLPSILVTGSALDHSKLWMLIMSATGPSTYTIVINFIFFQLSMKRKQNTYFKFFDLTFGQFQQKKILGQPEWLKYQYSILKIINFFVMKTLCKLIGGKNVLKFYLFFIFVFFSSRYVYLILFIYAKHDSEILYWIFKSAEIFNYGGLTEMKFETKLTIMLYGWGVDRL